jgi:glycosyltransferase involved in cell wall biosynthesis
MRSSDERGLRKRLRVAVVAPTIRILGGHAVQAARILDGWRDDSAVDAWLVPINPMPPPPLDRLISIKGVRTVATQLCYWPLLWRELRRADVVHLFSASYSGFLLSTLPAVVVARALGKPIVLNYHSGAAPDHLGRSWLARTVIRDLARINVVPSPFLRSVFERFGIAASVVSNTIDVTRFGYRPRNPLRPHLISTRNFDALYNVGCTLRAFARVQATYPDAALTVIGGGPQEAQLRELAASLQLRHVTFLGRVSPESMPEHYRAADIYVQTPSIDNMPLSVLEAFASGLPVVSTDVGGVPTILHHGRHGLLAADNDDQGIARHVLDLLANPERARELASAARDSCSAYEWSRVRDGWLSAYHEALTPSSDRQPVPVEAAR